MAKGRHADVLEKNKPHNVTPVFLSEDVCVVVCLYTFYAEVNSTTTDVI